ncbi:MAG: diguanylate cyclase [Xanthomonadales bacterium]|nr:diguanylate cyclase [Xanthomonadales bacterium]
MTPAAYLIISLLISSLMLCAIFVMAWHSFGRPRHALAWAAAFLFGGIQWGINALSDRFPSHDAYWLVAVATGILVVSLALAGFLMWSGRKAGLWSLVAAGLVVWGGVAWFKLGQPHLGLNMFIGPAYGGVLCCLCGVIIFNHRDRVAPAEAAAAVVFVMFGLSQVLAGSLALMQGVTPDPYYAELYSRVNFLALPAGYIGMGLFTVFLLASDLSMQMKALANTDAMTGILNRRGMEQAASPLIERAIRYQSQLALLVFDVDHFKQINDRLGHGVGDQVLVDLALYLSRTLRSSDVLARFGGEEFAIILPDQTLQQAVETAQRLRQGIEDLDLPILPDASVTASVGVSVLSEGDRSLDDLLRRADRAMYRSKRGGRNRVTAEPATAA